MLLASEALNHYSHNMADMLNNIESKILDMRGQDEYSLEYVLPDDMEKNKIDHIIKIFRDAGYLTFYDQFTHTLLISIPILEEHLPESLKK